MNSVARIVAPGVLLIAASLAYAQTNTFPSSGNVGIGTTTPATTLEVSGMATIGKAGNWASLTVWRPDGKSVVRVEGINGNSEVGFGDGTTHGGPAQFCLGRFNTDNSFRIASSQDLSTNPRLTILIGGNVGIGTTAPDALFTVKGRIHATEVVVDTSVAAADLKIRPAAWADDVFDEGRALTPLAQLEQDIKQTKHLPGIPSAAEVAANGISVGDMQVRLLAKIEELTLHQIEQEKRLAALERENAALKAQLTR